MLQLPDVNVQKLYVRVVPVCVPRMAVLTRSCAVFAALLAALLASLLLLLTIASQSSYRSSALAALTPAFMCPSS